MPTWIRVKDPSTGHEFDVSSEAELQDGLEVLTDYPENSGTTAVARPAKHRVTKAGKTATTKES